MLGGEDGRVGIAAARWIHDIRGCFNGSIQPKFRFDPVHG